MYLNFILYNLQTRRRKYLCFGQDLTCQCRYCRKNTNKNEYIDLAKPCVEISQKRLELGERRKIVSRALGWSKRAWAEELNLHCVYLQCRSAKTIDITRSVCR
jgi:hypothetical protein